MYKFLFSILLFSNILPAQTYSIFRNFETNKCYLENDNNGKMLNLEFDEIYRSQNKSDYLITILNKKYGLINNKGDIVFDNIYDKITVSDCDIVTTKNDDKKVIFIGDKISGCKPKNFIINKKDKKFGALNSKSEIIVPYEYDYITHYGVFIKNDKYGLIDTLGNQILQPKFEGIIKFSSSNIGNCSYEKVECDINDWYVVTMKSDEKTLSGIVDSNGKFLVPLEYENIYNIVSTEKLIAAQKNGKFGFIDINNKVIIPFEYDRASDFHDGLASVEKNNKIAMINAKNEIVIPFDYYDDLFFKFNDGVAIFSTGRNQRYGLINVKGKLVTDNNFDEIIKLQNSKYYYAKKEGKSGIINREGQTIIPFQYDFVRVSKCADKELFIVTQNRKTGIIDINNQIKIPLLYDHISADNDVISLPKGNLAELRNCDFTPISKTRFKKYNLLLNSEKISVLDEFDRSYNIDRNGKITTKK